MTTQRAIESIANQEGECGMEPLQPSQYDAVWITAYRKEISFDALGMLSATQFDTASGELELWEQLWPHRQDPEARQKLESMLAQGKQRELLAALSEEREPTFSYPAIPLDEVEQRLQGLFALQQQIQLRETNAVVRRLYTEGQELKERGAIPYYLHLLRLIEATAHGDSEAFWYHNTAIYQPPTDREMQYALSRVKWFVQRGLEIEHTKTIALQLKVLLEEQLSLALNDIPDTEALELGPPIDISLYGKPLSSAGHKEVSPERFAQLFAALFRDQGCVGWETLVDYAARNTRIEPGQRRYIVAGVPYALNKVIEQVAHEWGAHIAPRVAGEHSPLGLLGIGTGWSLMTEEGLGLYYEWELAKLTGQRFDEAKLWLGTLATGLAVGVLVPPQTFVALYRFFEQFFLLYRLIWRGDEDITAAQERAIVLAQTRCLRTYRGVPPGSRPGICFTKDAVYERGFLQVYHAVQQDKMILDWLATGIMALGEISEVQALGILPAAHSPRELFERPDLEAYILSLEEINELPGS